MRVFISVASEHCGWGARRDASTWCWDGPGHPRQWAHLEDNSSTRQLGQGTRRGVEGEQFVDLKKKNQA